MAITQGGEFAPVVARRRYQATQNSISEPTSKAWSIAIIARLMGDHNFEPVDSSTVRLLLRRPDQIAIRLFDGVH